MEFAFEATEDTVPPHPKETQPVENNHHNPENTENTTNTANTENPENAENTENTIPSDQKENPPADNNSYSSEDEEEKNTGESPDIKTSTTENANPTEADGSAPKVGPYGALATDPILQKLLSENPAFVNLPIPSEPVREVMPHWLDLNKKMNIWSAIKDLVGKDLSRLAVPVWLNEPLSMLERLSEQLEYPELLTLANEEPDSCMRMAYVMAFAISQYPSMIGRIKKPFNPILGETFEYIHPQGAFRFLSEQVSHHPPISAGFAESENFLWWGDSDIKTSFWGTSFEAKPLRPVHVILKKNSDHFIFKRPTMSIQNLILGTMYLDNFGDMPFENVATGEVGLAQLKKRGWGGKNAYELDGGIKNKEGQIVIKINGKWDSQITGVDLRTNKEFVLWTRSPVPENYEQQHSFSKFTKQLNYLHTELVPKLPPTDCRFRTDQRAFEHGDVELAKTEKLRLENKQRARRAQMKEANLEHRPKWFVQTVDPRTQEFNYEYTGGYWECRDKGVFPDSLDLYN